MAAKRIYNLYKLVNSADLETNNAIKVYGGRHAYFERLDDFTRDIGDLLERLENSASAEGKVFFLKQLQAMLASIFAVELSTLIEQMIGIVESKGATTRRIEQIHVLLKQVRQLSANIEAAFINIEDVKAEEFLDMATTKDTGGQTRMMPHPSLFTNLLNNIQYMNFEFAACDAKALANFDFGGEVNKVLADILCLLNNDDCLMIGDEMEKLTKLLAKQEKVLSNGKKIILAIDDVPDMLRSIRNLLKSDFDVYCVQSYLAALKFVTDKTPDLILIDIEMPDMNGFELLRLLRKMANIKNTPAIFLTGNVSVENVKFAIESGGNDFVKNPIELDVLMSKIRKHI